MGHVRSSIFQVYVNDLVKLDVQAAFLGRPSQDATIRATGHGSRSRHQLAPTNINEVDLDICRAIQVNSELVKLKEARNELIKMNRYHHDGVKRAEGLSLVPDLTC